MFEAIMFLIWIFWGASFSFLPVKSLFLVFFFYMGYNKYPEKEEWDVLPGVQPNGLFRGHLQDFPVPGPGATAPRCGRPGPGSPSCTRRTCTSRARCS